MSGSAPVPAGCRSGGERGLSLVEVSMVSVTLTVLAAVIIESIRGLSTAQASMRNQTRVTSLVERLATFVETDGNFAQRVFGEGDYGRAYLGRMALASILPPGAQVLADSRMPVATMRGKFEHDAPGVYETGNLFFLARRDGSVSVDISGDDSGDLRRVDRLRFVAWFLHGGGPTGVDLARYVSVPVARAADVNAVGDPIARTRLVTRLVAAGIAHAWDPGAAAANALFAFSAGGSIAPLPAGSLLPADRQGSEASIVSRRHLGVARNGTAGAEVPMFANALRDYPCGFELAHEGDGTGDLLLVRLVLAAVDGGGRTVAVGKSARQVAFRQE